MKPDQIRNLSIRSINGYQESPVRVTVRVYEVVLGDRELVHETGATLIGHETRLDVPFQYRAHSLYDIRVSLSEVGGYSINLDEGGLNEPT